MREESRMAIKVTVWCTSLMMTLTTVTGWTPSNDLKEYCFPNSFNASCGPNDVILMGSARYGRMREGKCLSTALHIGCWADVLSHVDRKCSGRHECIIGIPDTTLQNLQPCPKDMFAYLEASFTCLPAGSGVSSHSGWSPSGHFKQQQSIACFRPRTSKIPKRYIITELQRLQ
ncbi:hypothetical protein LSH36_13g05051 [Paralvinella palmiformis]|uniref:SUEL-type lectin domain-containing protein n=1 Tax=Paralvinella palmiformis TaxID=53620 RepID=A0AAD9KCQ0_9ANNE|nr:hypothetical protein LSH36_13g05051 [Paralvinella palmiformis]